MSVLKIPLDKELTANCLMETRTKLEGTDPGCDKVQHPLRLQQSLIKWFLMVWFIKGHSSQGTFVKFAEAALNYIAGDVVHLKSPAF